MSRLSSERMKATLSEEAAEDGHGALMDRIYRNQRHVYDLTRRYFLLGRETLIKRMEIEEGDRVLEIGCGTARNLIHLARRVSSIELFGIDASGEMLKSARRNIVRAGMQQRIRLECCLAEGFSPLTAFRSTEPFDAVFFSYSLSMIPNWRPALDRGLLHLKTGRSLWVVDFWDQRGLPGWFANGLKQWLNLFHVHPRLEVLEYFRELEMLGHISLFIEPLYRRYAYLVRLTKIS